MAKSDRRAAVDRDAQVRVASSIDTWTAARGGAVDGDGEVAATPSKASAALLKSMSA